jgi:hypothetical protein
MPRITEAFDKIQCEEIDLDHGDLDEDLDMEKVRNIWEEKIKMGGTLPTFPITLSCHNDDNG